MVITEEGKIILAKFVDKEQIERSEEEAKTLVHAWMKETQLYNIGMDIIMRIDAHNFFKK